MPRKCPIAAKEYQKEYRLKNKTKLNKKLKEWQQNNPEKNHKWQVIGQWLFRGIIDGDLSSVYDYSITQTHCWICGVEYNNSYRRCLDHDHTEKVDDNIRYICCNVCNSKVVG